MMSVKKTKPVKAWGLIRRGKLVRYRGFGMEGRPFLLATKKEAEIMVGPSDKYGADKVVRVTITVDK